MKGDFQATTKAGIFSNLVSRQSPPSLHPPLISPLSSRYLSSPARVSTLRGYTTSRLASSSSSSSSSSSFASSFAEHTSMDSLVMAFNAATSVMLVEELPAKTGSPAASSYSSSGEDENELIDDNAMIDAQTGGDTSFFFGKPSILAPAPDSTAFSSPLLPEYNDDNRLNLTITVMDTVAPEATAPGFVTPPSKNTFLKAESGESPSSFSFLNVMNNTNNHNAGNVTPPGKPKKPNSSLNISASRNKTSSGNALSLRGTGGGDAARISNATSLFSLLGEEDEAATVAKSEEEEDHDEGKGDLRFLSSFCSIPMAAKRTRGEDAYFVAETAIGVADGVGGWSAYGIDSGLYSRKLMSNAQNYAEATSDPREILKKAYAGMGNVIGTTTASIITLDEEERKIKSVNLGDSGFVLLRRQTQTVEVGGVTKSRLTNEWFVAHRTKEQQHYFNCPKQIGTDATDYPEDADFYEVTVQPGDLIVLATDGVFDNCFDKEIAAVVRTHFESAAAGSKYLSRQALKNLAGALARQALEFSKDLDKETPFSVGAMANEMDYRGGKQDDITVVVSMVASKAYAGLDHAPTMGGGGPPPLARTSLDLSSPSSSASEEDMEMTGDAMRRTTILGGFNDQQHSSQRRRLGGGVSTLRRTTSIMGSYSTTHVSTAEGQGNGRARSLSTAGDSDSENVEATIFTNSMGSPSNDCQTWKPVSTHQFSYFPPPPTLTAANGGGNYTGRLFKRGKPITTGVSSIIPSTTDVPSTTTSSTTVGSTME